MPPQTTVCQTQVWGPLPKHQVYCAVLTPEQPPLPVGDSREGFSQYLHASPTDIPLLIFSPSIRGLLTQLRTRARRKESLSLGEQEEKRPENLIPPQLPCPRK